MIENFQQPQDSAAVFAACLEEAKAIVASYREEAPTGCDPQNVLDLPPDFDTNHANFNEPSSHVYDDEETVAFLVALSAFALIGIGAFFTPAAAVAGNATTVTYVVGGETLVFSSGTALTAQQATYAAVIESGALATEPVAVMAILSSWGFRLMTLDSILALAAFNVTNPPLRARHYGGHGNYYADHMPGGNSTPPGFPGFPGMNPGQGNGTFASCYTYENVRYCLYYGR